ncbi:lantibiotic dehydratase family protein [Aquimarina sp. MMG016]|uniref:lantibiotic dehydratase family protein n=1 Tax=Aquimarina sp. MMG016 TaxID=2822690 RepID=UPI001B3A1869|nr:lantibiotic dehydratase family protein [Aquimarina sp. MMG016]MBQ4818848.1 lantibiotic dehydratase family protein [Aquimarina sp. MMG016]
MKSKNPYTFFDQYCLRTSLVGLNKLHIIDSASKIRKIWKDPVIKEAIFLASPDLYAEIDKSIIANNNLPSDRLLYALLKYITRISSRCTPFGLFAGCSVGRFDNSTNIKIAPSYNHKRQTRLDMNFVVAWAQNLAKLPEVKQQLLWYPNNSLYKIGDQFRYVEYIYNKFNRREHSLEAITYTEYLETIVEKAKTGATIKILAELLVDDEITIDEALAFIEELIDNQVLVSQLEPTVTGDDFLMQIQEALSGLKETEGLVAFIEQLFELLNELDTQIGNSIKKYNQISQLIDHHNISFELKYLFQTDLYPKYINNELNKKWAYRIKKLLPVFNKMTVPHKDTNLDRFIAAFTKRYETREVELTTALDTEIGIGYLQHQDASDSTPFLDGLDIPRKVQKEQQIDWNPFCNLLHQKLKKSAYTIEIEDTDLEGFEENWNDLPDTLSTMAELIQLDGEEKMILGSIGGSSATNLLGRFTTGNQELLSLVKEITDTEEQMNPGAILAEIIHLPESRTGNVIRRETLREYEIPYLGKSSVAIENQIPIDDLMISIKGGKVHLRSKKHNKNVLPKLSNAHNYSANALPIYHFLCDVQKQKLRSGVGFNWGAMLEKRAFLPRVMYKDFILSKARWVIKKEDITGFLNKDKEILIETITTWRASLRIPKLVQLVDGDNTLLMNLENYNMIKMWLDTVKKRKEFILEEFFFTEECIVKRGNEGFTNQFVISFYNEEKLKNA